MKKSILKMIKRNKSNAETAIGKTPKKMENHTDKQDKRSADGEINETQMKRQKRGGGGGGRAT